MLLGGNEGDVKISGDWVAQKLSERYHLEDQSAWYASPSWGFEGPDFLNRVIALRNVPDVKELLRFALSLEAELGRTRSGFGYTNRVMDIDILYHGKVTIEESELQIPHPRLQVRRFTLMPLVEKWANFVHPVLHKTQNELLLECPDKSEVRIVE